MWVRVPDKSRKRFEANGRSEIPLCSISHGKNRNVLESDRMVLVSRHCNVEEDTFPMKRWRNVLRVNRKEVDKFPDSSLKENVVIDGKHDETRTPDPPMIPDQEGQVDNDSSQVVSPTRETREKVGVVPRRTTIMRRAPDPFENYA